MRLGDSGNAGTSRGGYPRSATIAVGEADSRLGREHGHHRAAACADLPLLPWVDRELIRLRAYAADQACGH